MRIIDKITFRVLISILILSIFLVSCTFYDLQEKNTLRLGFMPNVTHATALVGIEKNIFQEELGNVVKLKPISFLVGNSIIDAFITGQIDAAYIGPGPFINAIYRKIPIQLLANAANGGTLIVGTLITRSLLDGARIAVPQYGNTQDLILHAFLAKNNLLNKTKIVAIPPQDTAVAFFTMSIDAACLPEPWGTFLEEMSMTDKQFSIKTIADEKNVLKNGNYPTSLLVAKSEYIKNNPNVIRKLLIVNKKSNFFIQNNPNEASRIVASAIERMSKKSIDMDIVAKSMKRCMFQDKINLNILREFVQIGINAGYYKEGFLRKFNETHIN